MRSIERRLDKLECTRPPANIDLTTLSDAELDTVHRASIIVDCLKSCSARGKTVEEVAAYWREQGDLEAALIVDELIWDPANDQMLRRPELPGERPVPALSDADIDDLSRLFPAAKR